MKTAIAIVGTTGVGKSKLAIQLAQLLNAHVINTDSMQIYKQLDIVTNKPTKEEREMVPHHLFDYVDPKNSYTVHEYTRDALQLMDGLEETPILCGGTHYYLEKVLWNESLSKTPSKPISDVHLYNDIKAALEATDPQLFTTEEIQKAAAEQDLFGLCQKIDPEMAEKWHPKDHRRIRTTLLHYFTTGTKLSDSHKGQNSSLRYKTIIFWLFCQPNDLDPRLDARVDQMVEQGLFEEIKRFEPNASMMGLSQCIGFKEFNEYLQNPSQENAALGIHLLKQRTRQYARTQIKWIRNKLFPRIQQDVNGAFYILDATDLSQWDTMVSQAFELIKNFQEGKKKPFNIHCPSLTLSVSQSPLIKFECQYCQQTIVGQEQWKQHCNSIKHKRKIVIR